MQRGAGRKVLIADDDPDFRNRLESVLNQEGYEVTAAEDGVKALEQARETTPDFLLLDAMMPRMDGFEVLSRLREDPKRGQMQVVLLTGLPAAVEDYPAISRPGQVLLCDDVELIVIKPLLNSLYELVTALEDLEQYGNVL